MDSLLKSYLEKYNIAYKTYEHPAVFTVAESKNIKTKIPAEHTKCLFLKDEKYRFYLICIKAEKRLNTKILKEHFNVKELHFSSPEELKSQLNLTPGSVSLFGMIHISSAHLIIDKELWEASAVGFHPNHNTATLVLDHENLEKFYNTLNAKKEILQL